MQPASNAFDGGRVPRAPRSENLWLKAIRNYWADPANIIGPPGALVRRLFKFSWLALSIYVLLWIAGPSQVASWRLWMEDDNLAEHIAWGFTLGSGLCFAIVGYAAEVTNPLRIPLIVPTIEFEAKKYKGWRIRPMHLHLPSIRVLLGSVLCAGLFAIALLGMYNFYLHEQQQSGGASVAAISGSTDRVGEAERALTSHTAATVAALAIIDQGIRETSAGSPTGRARLVRQRTELMTSAAATEAQLRTELREARAATVTTHQTFADPRPVDGQVATWTNQPRGVVASMLDLLRSGVVELMLVMGAGLGVAGATSRIGVREGEEKVSRETAGITETVAETTAAPAEEPAAQPPPRRRFTLPSATAEDHARAAAIGPVAWAAPADEALTPETETPATDDPGANEEPLGDTTTFAPSDEGEEIIDPLVAEHLSQPEAQQAEPQNV